jgi:hypothetical protein
MKNARHLPAGFLALAVMTASVVPARAEEGGQATPVVVCPSEAGPHSRLAAKEIARYVFLCTGALPDMSRELPARGNAIVLATAAALGAEAFVIRTERQNGRRVWTISGGSPLGQLYGSYCFAEKLGVRFYLHGDVIPDERLKELPVVNETGQPLFALRGVNPWGSHPFGFDAWGADDYKAICTQLAKMRMNFLGVHCYPEGHPYSEPTVWHGRPGDFDDAGRVKFSYVSRYFNTLLTPAWGDYQPKKTSEYSFGGAWL